MADTDDELLAAIVRTADDGIYSLSLDGTITSWNRAAERIFGYAADEVIGTNIARLVPPGRPNDGPELLSRIGRGESIRGYETLRFTRDARSIEVVLTVAPITGADGHVEGAATIAREIGELQRDEETRRIAEERFRGILEAAPIALMIVDAQGRIEFANERACQLFGYDRYELLQQDLVQLLPDRVRPRRSRVEDEGRSEDEVGALPPDALGLRRDGTEFPIELGINTFTAGGRRLVAAAVADLSARREIEDALIDLANHQAVIADLGRRALEGIPLQTLLDEACAVVSRVLGLELAKVLELDPDGDTLLVRAGVGWQEGVVGTRKVPADATSQAGLALRSHEPVVVENLAGDARLGGTALLKEHGVVSGLCAAIHGREGPYGVLGAHSTRRRTFTRNDVNFLRGVANILGAAIERRRSEEELRTTTETLATLVDAAPVAVSVLDVGGAVRVWNRAAEELYGWPARDIVGRVPWAEPTAAPEDVEVFRRILAGETVRGQELQRSGPGGALMDVQIHGAPLRDRDGRITGAVALVADATATKRLEEQLLQAQKMESIGRLAGGVAHDFNNLLTGIFGYSSLLADELADADSNLRDLVDGIRQSADKAASLTAQLLAFSRRQVLQPRVIDLNEVVQGIEPLLRRIIGETISLVTVPQAGIGQLRADPTQLEQVIVNLVVNGRDAMPDGGSIVIETDEVHFDEAYAQEHFDVSPGHYVMLAVSDAGVGMDAETRTHLFEPFYTTKGPGKGTGLGLATTYGIVKQSGGHIWLYSEPGRGTTFKLYFPRAAAPLHGEGLRQQAPVSGRGSETILLVEDERSVREITRRVLVRKGYRVLVAAEGQAALAISDSQPGRIDLLITDVVMPGIGGRALAEQIQARRPDIRTLFISGYTEDAIVRQGVLDANVAFLAKPFAPEALARAVRNVLTAPQGTRIRSLRG